MEKKDIALRYDEILRYFDENKIDALIKKLDELVFTQVEDIRDKFKQHSFGCEEEYREALNFMTANYSVIEIVFNQSQAYKEMEEDRIYHFLRDASEKEEKKYEDKLRNFSVDINKKMTDQSLKAEAHRAVGQLIRYRNLFESYMKTCSQFIITIQSQLKQYDKENYHKNGQTN